MPSACTRSEDRVKLVVSGDRPTHRREKGPACCCHVRRRPHLSSTVTAVEWRSSDECATRSSRRLGQADAEVIRISQSTATSATCIPDRRRCAKKEIASSARTWTVNTVRQPPVEKQAVAGAGVAAAYPRALTRGGSRLAARAAPRGPSIASAEADSPGVLRDHLARPDGNARTRCADTASPTPAGTAWRIGTEGRHMVHPQHACRTTMSVHFARQRGPRSPR